ncbi:MAG: hypothetical protein LJE74_09855 [Proteobacteria bacterium]|nr:hypothetical protein [Pseudomonadota bacterium]MCG6936248.1 hypothetical protein [Pseudomonadota bacterium]
MATQVMANDPMFRLTAEQWAVPRSAETVISMPALANTMQTLRDTTGGRLLLRYPGGDAGTLWMNELRSWLIALGVASSMIETVPGSPDEKVIELEVLPPLGGVQPSVPGGVATGTAVETVRGAS